MLEHCDQAGEQKIVNLEAVLQELRNKRLQNPAVALAAALRRVEVWVDAGSSTAGGSRR